MFKSYNLFSRTFDMDYCNSYHISWSWRNTEKNKRIWTSILLLLITTEKKSKWEYIWIRKLWELRPSFLALLQTYQILILIRFPLYKHWQCSFLKGLYYRILFVIFRCYLGVSLIFDSSICPAGRPAGHLPGRTSSELAGNQLNLLCNIGRSYLVEL